MGLLGVIGLIVGVAIAVTVATHSLGQSDDPVTVIAQSSLTLAVTTQVVPDFTVWFTPDVATFCVVYVLTNISLAYICAYQKKVHNDVQATEVALTALTA